MTDISYETGFESVICLDNWLMPNLYRCKLDFEINTDDVDHQTIAFERCKIFIESIMADSLMINIENPLLPTLTKKTKQQIITLPSEPLDVIIAAMIFSKLNAILEDKMYLTNLQLTSSQGENIWVHFDQDFHDSFQQLDNKLFTEIKETPWWRRSDASVSDWFEFNKKEVKFHKHVAKWESPLNWDDKVEKSPITKWKPTVIDGGKTKH
jgi:hypothetical protein